MNCMRITKGQAVLLTTLFLTLAFIFIQSSLPPSASGSEIDAVGGAMGNIFSADSAFGAFLQRNVSNIAHFCEYGVLGAQISIGIFMWFNERLRWSAVSLFAAVSVSFLDESVQILSGRHASVVDMWIDVLGYSVFYMLAALIFAIIRRKKSKATTALGESNGKNNRC